MIYGQRCSDVSFAAPEQAYTDYHGMMDLTEDLIRAAAREVTGGLQVGMPPRVALASIAKASDEAASWHTDI